MAEEWELVAERCSGAAALLWIHWPHPVVFEVAVAAGQRVTLAQESELWLLQLWPINGGRSGGMCPNRLDHLPVVSRLSPLPSPPAVVFCWLHVAYCLSACSHKYRACHLHWCSPPACVVSVGSIEDMCR